MSIAPMNAIVLSLTEEKSSYETQRTIIDGRRQLLMSQAATVYSDLTAVYAKLVNSTDADEDVEITENDSTEAFDLEAFRAELENQQKLIQNQDKALENQRANISTKIDAITTQLESAQKILTKNVESEMKSLGS